MGSALMDAGIPPNPVRFASHAEGIVDLRARERRPEIMDDRDELSLSRMERISDPSAGRSCQTCAVKVNIRNRSVNCYLAHAYFHYVKK
jgi:hypothetical protein